MAKNIAVNGASVAGISCASNLNRVGGHLEVFDKGRGLGGRLATWQTDSAQFDHDAQCFTARSLEFAPWLYALMRDGAVAPWKPLVQQGTTAWD